MANLLEFEQTGNDSGIDYTISIKRKADFFGWNSLSEPYIIEVFLFPSMGYGGIPYLPCIPE